MASDTGDETITHEKSKNETVKRKQEKNLVWAIESEYYHYITSTTPPITPPPIFPIQSKKICPSGIATYQLVKLLP
jgi:hypothetical protein